MKKSDVNLERKVTKTLTDLIRIPSINPEGVTDPGPEHGEERIARYVYRTLRRAGIKAWFEPVEPHRPNVIARIRPKGRPIGRVLLETHLDTVGVEGMTIPPFGARIKKGKIYGRGASDCKASLAAMLCALTGLDRERLSAEVWFAAVIGEERTMIGARRFIRRHSGFDCAVVGEPSELDVVVAHKGVVRWQIETFGKMVHGARAAHGINAVYKMNDFIHAFMAGPLKKKGRIHPLLGGRVFNLGKIEGGFAYNVVPPHCLIQLEARTLPGEKEKDVTAEVTRILEGRKKKDRRFRYRLKVTGDYPGLETAESAKVVQGLLRAAGTFNIRVKFPGKLGVTDAGIYSAAGIPSVVYGPGTGKLSHTEAECADLEQVVNGVRIYREFLENY